MAARTDFETRADILRHEDRLMRLQELTYSEYEGEDQEWTLEGLSLGRRNLLVGKNATGKTRTLNVIAGLAQLLCGECTPRSIRSGKFRAFFDDHGKTLQYDLNIQRRRVVSERFAIDRDELLVRDERGEGVIRAVKVIGEKLDFQTAESELTAHVKRDAKQHPFLEPLYQWGFSTRHYRFGTEMGKDRFAVPTKRGGAIPDGKSADEVIGLFQRAKRDFKDVYISRLMADMAAVDYPLEGIDLDAPITVNFDDHPFENDPVVLRVKERGLRGFTDQLGMSQGMFRVLSLLSLVNYLECGNRSACIIIDDIGEGLDFDRSCLLIDLLRAKADNDRIQLIASTNDKFVMNKVPLDEWSVLQRDGSHVRVRNVRNSRELFEEFRFTGLSNFSFLEMDFANAPPAEVPVAP